MSNDGPRFPEVGNRGCINSAVGSDAKLFEGVKALALLAMLKLSLVGQAV